MSKYVEWDEGPSMTWRQIACLRALRVPAAAYIHYDRTMASRVIKAILAAQTQPEPREPPPEASLGNRVDQ